MQRVFLSLGLCLGTLVIPAPILGQILHVPAGAEFRVKLLGPISSETSQATDKITAQVIRPHDFADYFVEGQIRDSKARKGRSFLSLYFDTLEAPDYSSRLHVESSMKSVVNSQGKVDADEEGNVIRKTNNVKAAPGIGILIEIRAESGTRITFAPGSEFVLFVKERQESVRAEIP